MTTFEAKEYPAIAVSRGTQLSQPGEEDQVPDYPRIAERERGLAGDMTGADTNFRVRKQL